LAVRDAVSYQAELAGYGYVELPVFEHIEVFTRGVGEQSDLVTKEMYTFDDRGERRLALRPEGTASVCRAVVENGLAQGQLPVKLWYAGPFFRAERPQQGRYRQLQQVGIEAIGVLDPLLDAEVIIVANSAFQSLGLSNYRLLINSLGGADCRSAYRSALQGYLLEVLPHAMHPRVRANPLRILDDKSIEVRNILGKAPSISAFWTSTDRDYFESLKDTLVAAGLKPIVDERLVRGLDYYTGTVFEFDHPDLGAQSGIGGGGRYDGLMAALGGPELSGVGFGVGVDRTLIACEAEGTLPTSSPRVQVYAIAMVSQARAICLELITDLRAFGVSADMAFGERGLKGAMKAAARSGAQLALIVGENELAQESVTVKNLTTSTQETHRLDKVAMHLAGKFQANP
jgi:histidyl-tRNA synthetase